MKFVFDWLAAIVFSFGTALFIAEMFLRFGIIGIRTPPVYESYWFSEHPENFRDQHESFGFVAYSKNREAALHADLDNIVLEYDVTFRTNNAGLVQQRDIDKTKEYIVVVGDSFTQGVGATPWFYELENHFPVTSLANLGLLGTGVSHWVRALQWFEANQARIRNVLVIFITDDFKRPHWKANLDQHGLSFCYVDHCELMATVYNTSDAEELLTARRKLLNNGNSDIEGSKHKLKEYLLGFRLGRVIINLRRWFLGFPAHDDTFVEENKHAFIELAKQHHILFALHLPQKEEAAAEHWSRQSLEIRRFVQTTGVRAVDGMGRCGLTISGFYTRDPHPNSKGYDKIERCVAELLEEAMGISLRQSKDHS